MTLRKIDLLGKFCIFVIIFLFHGCTQPDPPSQFECTPQGNLNTSIQCVDIKGRILGDVIPNSTISLYTLSSLNLTHVLTYIRTCEPIVQGVVNETKGFNFTCLSHGKYAAVILTTCYKKSVGSPLPYEFNNDNYSLGIVFQGGDYQHAIGAFTIIGGNSTENEKE